MTNIQLQKWVRKDNAPTWMLKTIYTLPDPMGKDIEYSTRTQYSYQFISKLSTVSIETNYQRDSIVNGTL